MYPGFELKQDEPSSTAELKFVDDVLHQKFIINHYFEHSLGQYRIHSHYTYEWQPVKRENSV